MLVKKNLEGKITGLSNIAKSITAILVLIGVFTGAVFFMEDRYMKASAAEEIKVNIEEQAVKTFEQQQQILDIKQEAVKKELDIKQKALEIKFNMEALQDLKDHKILLQKELKRDPNNELIQSRLERVQNKIEKIENKVYGE